MRENEKLTICIQCTDQEGKIGTFVRGLFSGKQYSKTYLNAARLFNSEEYKELKKNHLFI